MTSATPGPRPRWRRILRRVVVSGVVLLSVYGAAWGLGLIKLATPRDCLISLLPAVDVPALRLQKGPRPVVVLLHGMTGSSWSMWRLERTLERHGYDVLNRTYDEYHQSLAELGAELHGRIEEFMAGREGVPMYAVAHSMGGLVLRAYLARPDARKLEAAVCLGTPHGGAALTAVHGDSWYYRLLFGRKAAVEMDPTSDALTALATPAIEDFPLLGNVIGGRGDDDGYTARIPGDDDGRVGTSEAHLLGERDAITVHVHHSLLMVHAGVLRQALHFLRHERFER